MEARVYYLDGSIEVHRLPELVGDDLIPSPIETFNIEGANIPHNDLDRIPDIIEKFTKDAGGFYIERSVVLPSPNDGIRSVNGGRCCIVPVAKLSDVKLVLLDGEQVWPEQGSESIGSNSGALDAMFAIS